MVRKKSAPKKVKAKATKKRPKGVHPNARNPTPPPPNTPHNEEQNVIKAVLEERGLIYMIADRLGVTTQTIRNYIKRWPAVKEAVAKAKGRRLDKAESKLDSLIENGNVKAITYFLDRKGKNRGYIPRQELRVGGDKKAPPVQSENLIKVKDLPTDVLRQILAARKAQAAPEANGTPPQNAVEINLVSEGTGNEIGESSPACESHD